MLDLTARQAQLLAWMRTWTANVGYAPAHDVAARYNPVVAEWYADLEVLEARGLVTRHPGQPARWSATPEER